MSFVERRDVYRPKTGEAPFTLEDAFYSRTDKRGVIVAGNFVFQKVSGFPWDELLGAPHKVVRHPDMPKGVFHLLWDTIKRGDPMGAYVKNRTKDGLYYWVFAVIVPCGEGYLSARIKPTSKLRDRIEAEYAALREKEKSGSLSPEQSAAHLLERLRALGFSDYEQFSSHALSEELLARDKGLDRAPDGKFDNFRSAQDFAGKLEDSTDGLVAEFGRMRITPINMRVIASRLEPTGGPISSLSKNYGLMSQEITSWFDSTVVGPDSNFSTIRKSITHGVFVEGMARILTQCGAKLTSERRGLGEVNLETERSLLNTLVETYRKAATAKLCQVEEDAGRITAACKTMDRMILGLSTTKVLCSVENARLPSESESLTNIIEQLASQQERMSQQLEDIGTLSSAIRDAVSVLNKASKRR